jgi:flagellin-like hook-associated protein FlgL
MRIQHNIMAMNAYRNYNTNTSALSKNLEKLSSGYKINRAGDDAAGLAISEKMRAQITGLDAAQKNVKDGISLVKTAEGAMQEIQDMLNRMDYLATQSANGTYDNEVDRMNLQKEVDQLKSEINRIADSANFNGIKLLDGSLDEAGKTQAIKDAQAAVDAASQPAKADAVYTDKSADEIKDMMLDLVANGGAGSAANVGTNTVLETEKVEYQTPSFQVNLNGTSYTMTGSGTGTNNGLNAATDGLKLTIGAATNAFVLTEADMAAYLTSKGETAEAGYTLNSEDLAAAIKYKMDNAANGVGSTTGANMENAATTPGAGRFGDGDYAWDVRVDGESLVFEFADINKTPTTSLNKYYDTKVELNGTITNANVKATGGTYTTGVYTPGQDGTTDGTTVDTNNKIGDTSISVTTTIDGKNYTFTGTAAGSASIADMATAIGNATTEIDGKTVKLSDYFTVSQNAATTGAFDITSKAKGEENSDKINGITMTFATASTGATGPATDPVAGSLATAGANAWVDGTDAYTAGVNGYINAGTEVVIAGVPSESEQLASTTLDFSAIDITDGMKVTLGEETYIFAVGADSKFKDAAGDGVKVVDLSTIEADKLKATGGDANSRNLAFSKLTEAAKDNKIFTVSHETNGTAPAAVDQIGLKQKAEVKDSTDMTTLDKFASYIGVSAVNTAATDEAQKEADAAQADKLAAAKDALAEAEANGAKSLQLQIGDTSDKFNRLEVTIGDMHTSAMGTGKTTLDGEEVEVTDTIADVDISSLEGAQKAIATVRNAINYVSSVRGDLGATQNRLEHTANNLSVMSENITDAESTIRDTDIAAEMMSYTKNNILIQSAQAMLAQANAVPQGVLQLLG